MSYTTGSGLFMLFAFSGLCLALGEFLWGMGVVMFLVWATVVAHE